jgi:hypothetical protein
MGVLLLEPSSIQGTRFETKHLERRSYGLSDAIQFREVHNLMHAGVYGQNQSPHLPDPQKT